jgi:F-type H+-transporting ATPase subunit b
MKAFGTQWFFSAVLTGTLLASPVFAAEDAAEAAGKGGLPQFDVSYFPGQLFWLAISFAILYALMTFVALPKVKITQDRRHETLATELAAAAAANDKAKSIISQYEKALADARSQAQSSVSDIIAKAAKISAERQATQQQGMNKKLRDTEDKIAAARDAALGNAHVAAADIAGGMIEKIVGVKMRVKA